MSRNAAWNVVRRIVLLVAMATACAADFPQKTIRLIVPFPAGGTSDIVARIVAERASKSLG